MADEYGDEETPAPAAAQSPALQDFQQAFTHPVAQEWAGEVSARLNDYFTRRQIADDNQAAGDNFVNSVDTFKSGLVDMVRSDPHAVGVALDIVPPTMRAFASAIPNAPEEMDHGAISDHIQGEIATAAVTQMANRNAHAARTMLDDDRISKLLGDNAEPLHTYINSQETARQYDNQAHAETLAAHAALAADNSAIQYLSGLVNPASNTLQFPERWNQSIVADPKLPASSKAGVIDIAQRLRANGDAERSDPEVITDAIRRAANGEPPSAGELLSQAGGSLTLSDALALARKLSVSPAAHVEAQAMQQTLDDARQQIAPLENGAAGAKAYGRFVNWFLGEYGRRGPASLNPQSENWLMNPEVPGNPVERFQPNGDDVIDHGYTPLANMAKMAAGMEVKRPSLDDIFSSRGNRAREPKALPNAPAGYEYDASGSLVPSQVDTTGQIFGVEPLTNDQAINPAGTDTDAAGHKLTEVRTDNGIKALSRTDILNASRGPRPKSKPALSEDEQQAFQNTGKLPAVTKTNSRSRIARRRR